MGDMKFPWEVEEPANLPAVPIEDRFAALQRDVAFMVTHTCVQVHSTHEDLRMFVNTPRGQIIPHGVAKYNNETGTDPHSVMFQDLGMPQVGLETTSLPELVRRVHETATKLGLSYRS